MSWKHPRQSWWLAACLLGLGVAGYAGGFGWGVAVYFALLFVAGAALLGQDGGTGSDGAPPD